MAILGIMRASRSSEVQALIQTTIINMYLIDKNGKSGHLPTSTEILSLKNKLQGLIPIAAKELEMDLSSPVYVWLDEKEEHYFLRSFQENHWIPLSAGEVFNPEIVDIIPALRAISDEVNDNYTNGYSRFIPLRARQMTNTPLGIKTL